MSEYIMKQGEDIYGLYRIDFQPQNFPVFYALSQSEKMGIMELAELLQLTHPGVIQQAKALEKMGLIDSIQGEDDRRRRWLSLSQKGKELLPALQDVWQDIQASLDEAVGPQPGTLLENLDRLEQNFSQLPFAKRVAQKRKERIGSAVEIIDYREEYKQEFGRINYAWIEKYFTIEAADRETIDQHISKILDKGGCILFARFGTQIIGTVALIKGEDGVYELVKMGVDEAYQGYRVGWKLGQAAIKKGKELSGRRIFLESNKRLGPAINLYKKLGFREVIRPSFQSEYDRCDIIMELYL
ncbi:MAG: bifunctional helix-turn-helix transcriptional regulator/GNAT family N-acetyltransferase [Saprospiraceae bacterium]|nr:bifunctional helix-turn-helix transcriptional regulator/GNAT family N-acetyltransferase [Saprospiraceae bacterium]